MKNSTDIRDKIQTLICDAIMESDGEDTRTMIHTVVGILEELKVGLITCCHSAGQKVVEQALAKDPTCLDNKLEQHKKTLEQLISSLKKEHNKKDDNDETTSTAA
jgi:hypothetical protein